MVIKINIVKKYVILSFFNKNINIMKMAGERTGFVQVGPQKWFFPSKYAKEAENIYNFPVRKDDVWIVTFPRSGKIHKH